jgi:hypothetical protein
MLYTISLKIILEIYRLLKILDYRLTKVKSNSSWPKSFIVWFYEKREFS